MAKDINSITIIGNLVADVEMKFSQEGLAITRFRLASNGYKDDDVLFVSVSTFGKLAEICGEFLKKGTKVCITGRLSIKNYETNTGEKRLKTEIVANELQILSKKEPNQS
jgi:single-strand DNA-binding protein